MLQLFDLICQWSQNNLDVVFFLYGLAFFVMGISILVQPKKESAFKLANILWLLAGFGMVHGINEWLDMWVLIKHRNEFLDVLRLLTLIISFIFLYEFGRRLLIESIYNKSPKWQKTIAQYFYWWAPIVIGVLVFIISFFIYHDFWKTGGTFARYFLCFPGAVLTGFGFFAYYRREEGELKNFKVKSYFLLSGLSFIFYGFLSGLVVPRGEFFPANWVNDNSFCSIIHIPVQVFRAILAIIATLSIVGIIKIFNWETRKKLEEALVTDELTGLYNRRGFFTVAEQQSKMARRLKKGILLIVADLDDLKTINDTFGHEEGDIALINTAKILKESFRESDVIGRIGGDEFAVFQIENVESSSQIQIARLVKNCNIYNERKDMRYKLSISAGIVRCDPDCKDSLDEMLSKADKLMYDHKKSKNKS
jgi:diguanylate cyclase (GGDEF)-like protein